MTIQTADWTRGEVIRRLTAGGWRFGLLNPPPGRGKTFQMLTGGLLWAATHACPPCRVPPSPPSDFDELENCFENIFSKNPCTFPHNPVWIYMEGKKKMHGAVEGMEGMGRMLAAPILQSAPKPASETLSPLALLDSLIVRVRRGDVGAFDEIMNETQGRVLGLAYRLLGDKELAKDASQEAFLRAFKSLDTFRLGESFTAWIGRIVANVCFDQMKKREIGDSATQLLESVPSPDSFEAEDAVLLNQRRVLIQKALAALSPAERSALVLRDIEGMSYHFLFLE